MENVDISYGPHLNTRYQVLAKYISTLKQLRFKAERMYEIRPMAFDNFVLFQYFQHGRNYLTAPSLETSPETPGFPQFSTMTFLKIELLNHILGRRQKILYCFVYLLLAILCIFVYRNESYSPVAEISVRSMVYPGIRMWRRMTLPLIKCFPSLTEFYDESCLMANPFFQIDGITCSLCAHVYSIMDLTAVFKSGNVSYKSILDNDVVKNFVKIMPSKYVPFLFKSNHEHIELQDVYNMYLSNQDIFERDAFRVQSTNRDITNLEELFNQFNQTVKGETHNLWRCNRMLPARLLRKLIARPSILPSNLALERYVAIDTPQALSYTLPDTECPNVYVQQSLGTRFIILRPTGECRLHCHSLSIRLLQSYVLSYNSWYWKPVSAPDPVSDSISISLIGSYC